MASYLSKAVSSLFGQDDKSGASALRLDISIRSPTVIPTNESQSTEPGLLTGHIVVNVREHSVQIASLKTTVKLHIEYNKPYSSRCNECRHRYYTLCDQQFLPFTTTYSRGITAHPFSAALDSNRPESMDTSLIKVSYEVESEALFVAAGSTSMSAVSFRHIVPVHRATQRDPIVRRDIRRLDPSIIVTASFNPVLYRESCKASFHLKNLWAHNGKTGIFEGWRLKQADMQIVEAVRVFAPPCERHSSSSTQNSSSPSLSPKGSWQKYSSVINKRLLTAGWESNCEPSDWSADLSFNCLEDQSSSAGPKFTSDIALPDGTEVSHKLVVSFLLSQYTAPEDDSETATPTGRDRISRMSFSVILTDSPLVNAEGEGEGEEILPSYAAAVDAPPEYGEMSTVDIVDKETHD